jgi:hypothetical protein
VEPIRNFAPSARRSRYKKPVRYSAAGAPKYTPPSPYTAQRLAQIEADIERIGFARPKETTLPPHVHVKRRLTGKVYVQYMNPRGTMPPPTWEDLAQAFEDGFGHALRKYFAPQEMQKQV